MPAIYAEGKLRLFLTERRIEQVIGREGETVTLLSRRPLNFELRVIGFAPRQFNRSTSS